MRAVGTMGIYFGNVGVSVVLFEKCGVTICEKGYPFPVDATTKSVYQKHIHSTYWVEDLGDCWYWKMWAEVTTIRFYGGANVIVGSLPS